MCLENNTGKNKKLYVHTSMYDVVVNKAEFWNCLRKSYPNAKSVLNKIDYNAPYAIFCYEVGIIKLDFSIAKNKYDIRAFSTEFESDTFENTLNEVLNQMLK